MTRKGTPARDRRDALDLTTRNQQKQLNRIYRRDGGICQLCGKPCPRAEASREHKVPLSEGGGKDDSNVILAHRTCNEAANRSKQLAQKEDGAS